jgi:MFS transporter, DHA1 family, inner membrane transport protein
MAAAKPQAKVSALLNILALGNFTVGMGAFVVIGIITPIADGLHIAKADAGIILTAYAIAYAVLSPVGAALTGSLSRRAVLTGALTLFCIGTVLSALAWSLPILAFSRILVAFGAALFTPLAASVAVAIAPLEQRGRALARVFGGLTLAQVAGVPLGAWLAYRFGWHATFWTVAALAAVTTAVLFNAIPTTLTFQTTTFVTILSALRNGRLVLAVTFTATIMTAVYIVFTFFGPMIEASAGSNPETRTFYLILFGAGAVIGNLAGGFFADRLGPKRTLIVICIAHIVLMPMFSVIPWHPVLFALLIAIWSTFGWAFMAPQQARLVAIAPQAQALALALNAAMIYVGIAIGSGIGSTLLKWQGLYVLGIAAGIGAAFALLHLLVSSRPERPAEIS